MEEEAGESEQTTLSLAGETASARAERGEAAGGDAPQLEERLQTPEGQSRYTPGGCLAALLIILIVLAVTSWSRDAGSAVGLTIGGTLLAVGIGVLLDRWLMWRE